MTRALNVATAPRRNTKTWRQRTMSWDEFTAWLGIHSPADHKDCGGYIVGELRNGQRTKRSVLTRDALALDADAADQSRLLSELEARGWRAVAHTTYRSTPDEPRWRVLILLHRPVTAEEYSRLAHAVIHTLGAEQFDPGSEQPERFMFKPSAKHPEHYEFRSFDGVPLDVDAALASAPTEPAPALPDTAPEPSAPVPEEQNAEYVQKAVRRHFEEFLIPLAELPEGETHPRVNVSTGEVIKEYGWEWNGGLQYGARRLVELSNAAPSAYSRATAEADFKGLDPGGFAEKFAHHWRDAIRAVGDRAATSLQASPEDDFGPGVGPSPVRDATDDSQDAEDSLARVRARYPLKNLRELLDPDRPPRPWVVEDFLPAEASASIIAPSGIGKSLFALSLSVAVARGDEYFAGLRIPERRRVLYVDWENGPYDYIERLSSLGFTPENVGVLDGWFFPLELPDNLPPLDTPEGRRELGAIIDAYGVRRQDLVVLDSTQRMVSGPENDADTWRSFYMHTAMMLKARGLTVLRMDNIGHQDKTRSRGSSSKRDDVDVQWIITVPKNAGPGVFDFEANKGRMRGELSMLTFERRERDGVLTWSTGRNVKQERAEAARRWLDDAGVPATYGVDAAWNAVKGDSIPFSREVIRSAQAGRKANAQHAAEDFTEGIR